MYGFGKFGGIKLGTREDTDEEPGRFRRPRKLSYLLRHPEFDQRHVGGVNAACFAPCIRGGGADGGADGGAVTQLYTAGRDGTVRAWNTSSLAKRGASADTCDERWEGHSSWVNDVCGLRTGSGNFLLSASSDSSVKVWSIDSPIDADDPNAHRCVASLTRHGDYVMKLASSDQSGTKFASAGLGETDNLFLWDAERATAVTDFSRDPTYLPEESTLVTDMDGQKESAYALAMDVGGNVLVSGCTGNVIRVWDARTGSRTAKLKGHNGNVRCATLSSDGRLCLTGSSDHTLRLWDLGQQRCVQTISGVHGCSVWSAAMDASWHVCYSGGADGRVYATDLAHKRTVLLFEEDKGVLSLTPDDGGNEGSGLWASTMGSSINRWSADVDWRDEEHVYTPGAASRGAHGHRTSGSYKDSPMSVSPKLTPGRASARMSNAWGKVQGSAHDDPIHKQPSATIKSTPPIVEHKQTSDRLHVLAKDTDGAISLWDVVKCERVKRWDAGGDDLFAEVLKDVNPRVSVPSWFTVDTRTGSIAVSLMPSGAFQAEAYALDMGVDGANDELKCNYGVQTIHMLLRGWKARRLRAMACEAGRELSSDDDDDSHLDFDVNALTPCGDAKVWRLPSRPPSLVCEQRDGEGAALMPVGEMAGSVEEHQALPEWIVEVISEKYRVPDSPKTSFHLAPHDTQPDAPKLSQGRVTAPRVLGIRKVAVYVANRLALRGEPEDLVDIICAGSVCDPSSSLATVKEFLWKKGSDVELVYRFKDGVDYGGDGGDGVATA